MKRNELEAVLDRLRSNGRRYNHSVDCQQTEEDVKETERLCIEAFGIKSALDALGVCEIANKLEHDEPNKFRYCKIYSSTFRIRVPLDDERELKELTIQYQQQ